MLLFGLLIAVLYSSHEIRTIRGYTMTIESQHQIIHDILLGYDKRVLPMPTEGPIVLKMGLALQQVITLDQKTEKLVISIWVRKYWNDPRLSWDPEAYNGTDVIYLENQQHWSPDLVFFDNVNSEHHQMPAHIPTQVSYDGNITCFYPAVITSICPQNIKHFPLDIQKCNLKFGSWALDGGLLCLTTKDENAADVNSEYMKSNDEWVVTNFTAQAYTNYYECCPHPFHDIVFTLKLSRNWQMIFMYLFIPNIFINILTVAQFLLPCDSTERCCVGITLFLAIIIFLLLLHDVLPYSNNIPIIMMYMSTTLILNGVSLICTILILWLHHSGEHDNHNALPHWARKYILHYLARILRMQQYITPDNEHDANLRDFHDTVELEEDEEDEVVELASETIDHNEGLLPRDESKTDSILRVRSHAKTSHCSRRVIIHSNKKDVSYAVNNIAKRMPSHCSKTHVSEPNHKDSANYGLGSSNSCKCENGQTSNARSSHNKIIGNDGSGIKVKIRLSDSTPSLNKTKHNSNKSIPGSLFLAELTSNQDILLLHLLKHIEGFKKQKTAETKDKELKCEWTQVAMVISRLLFFWYFIATGIMAICITVAMVEETGHSHV